MIVLAISVINWKIFQGPTRIFVVVFGHADAVYAWIHIVQKTSEIVQKLYSNGIFLPKLFWPTVRKNCSNDREIFFKFQAESREFAKILRSLEQFVQTVKGQNNFW